MVGRCFSYKKFNVIILAAGAGSRMGDASAFIPKALSPLGDQRAIDWIIYRYRDVALKFIIGVHTHADLLINYLKGRYPSLDIEFAIEYSLENNAKSTTICLDHADSRYPTLIHFCDLLMLDNFNLGIDQFFLVSKETEGVTGTFRHTITGHHLEKHVHPISIKESDSKGVLGVFSIGNTPFFKGILYDTWGTAQDLTDDGIAPYFSWVKMEETHCKKIIEFGDEATLQKARGLWEKI